jgi:drug/metabolite transporter (DMT)-like permease
VPSYLVFALVSGALYGIGGPLINSSIRCGLDARSLCFLCGTGFFLIGIGVDIFIPAQRSMPFFALTIAHLLGLAVGIVMGLAFATSILAFADPKSLFSIVTLAISSAPLVSLFLGALLYAEGRHFDLRLLFLGALLLVAGVYLISLSKITR